MPGKDRGSALPQLQKTTKSCGEVNYRATILPSASLDAETTKGPPRVTAADLIERRAIVTS